MFKIKGLREKKGLTQEKLAAQVGITRIYLSYVENGHCVPSVSLLQKISDVLDVNIADLFEKPAKAVGE